MSRPAQRPGSTRANRKIRAAVLRRDNYRCRLRFPDICTTIATVTHHTLGWHITGDNPDHQIAACVPCNQRVGDPRRQDPKAQPRRQW